MKHTILCVDDEIDNVDSLERLFRRQYAVLKATSGTEGLRLLSENPDVAVIISDQRMPQMVGTEFLRRSQKTHPDTIRILLTGYTDMDAVVDAINTGHVYRYITKPWDPIDLKNAVDKAAEKYRLIQEIKIKNQELEKALKELRVLDEAKTQFMILINHELKTPLTTLLSFLQILIETDLSEEQKKYASRIETSAARLNQIIEDVMELMAAQTGTMKLARKKIPLQRLFSSVIERHRERATQKGQRFELQPSDRNTVGDEKLLVSVLNKLVENAVKFGKADYPIELSALVEPDGDTLRVSVINQGKALPASTIEKILRPFALDENIMNHSEGLGLGLSAAQALLKHHGSALEIDCAKGEVRASFVLPVSR